MIAATLVAYCRAGFEAEVTADLARIATAAGGEAVTHAQTGAGYVLAKLAGTTARRFADEAAADPPWFARDWFFASGPHALLAAASGVAAPARADRVTPLLAAVAPFGRAFASTWVEFPDTNEGKALSTLAKALETRVAAALETTVARVQAAGHTPSGDARRLRIFLPDGATAWIGTSAAAHARWRMGIPRLPMPRDAPSRSTLKLAEAFAVFLGDDAARELRAGTAAVDLGAAPGGWSWQLAERGLAVTAVDNGPLKGGAAANPLITHLRADGLAYRPRKPVAWMVCDIVEQPQRIAALVADWIATGAARRSIFNLKLPMKKRYAEVEHCVARIGDRLARSPVDARLQLRQLYHDREEITGYLERVS